MNSKLVAMATAASVAIMAKGAGFGIYEASARGNALGGALVGETGDASSNYYNPANNAFATNIQVSAGMTAIYPYCDTDVDHRSQQRMHTNWFLVPTFYLTVPLPYDFAFGWGNYTEYGLGTHYGPGWDLAGDTQKTTMRQVTLSPTLSYKITDRWSIAGGMRVSWIQFSNHKQPYHGDTLYHDVDQVVQPGVRAKGTVSAPDAYNLHSKLKGDDWGWGWLAATTYKATDDLSFGLVYRSQIKHDIRGHFDMDGSVSGTASGDLGLYAGDQYIGRDVHVEQSVNEKVRVHSKAAAHLTLPRSITGGVNWKVTPRYRVGGAVTWTEWSSVDAIRFRIPNYGYTQKLKWNDVWRFGIGMEYDLYDWLTPRIGYAYDIDPSSKHNGTTMIPSGDRHIISLGLGFKLTENLFLDFGYSFIRMNNHDRIINVKTPEGVEKRYKWSTRNGFSHLPSLSLRYYF